MVHSLIEISLLEELSKRAVFSFVIDYILRFCDPNGVKRGYRRGFVGLAQSALVTCAECADQNSNDRDYDQKFDQSEAVLV